MRKGVICFIFLILLCAGAFAQSFEQQFESGIDDLENAKKSVEDAKWDYLKQEWTKLISEHPALGKIHSALLALNPVFIFLFAYPYSLSLTLVFVILIWIFFANAFANILRSFSLFNVWVCYALGALLAVASAHLGLYAFLATFLFKVLFYKEGIWGWVIALIMLAAYSILIVYVRYLGENFSQIMKKRREFMQEQMDKIDRDTARLEAKGMKKAFKDVSDALDNYRD
ncbi:hypothetical protein HYZ97_04740 [Candidatus Pacearchaeota archaeon]|nr:hypothetical protein [Candidatus Pacearchaeota archaeon]